ncbi:MAG: HAMP domain-containing histidine kinase [Planctomycetes bacterium]|nr:HAMP domain-containing histidine kinase [Planctomycetota bacterium]
MSFRVRNLRAMQIGVIGLLVTCVAQVTYWVAEEADYTRRIVERLSKEYDDEVPVAERLVALGVPKDEVERLLPHVTLEGLDAKVPSALLDELEDSRRRRLRRYGWEGSFFFAALLASMGIVAQALRQRSELHRRQENFIAAVSHEFKSPLASLRLAAETLQLREPSPESRERLTARMVSDVERLEGMVSNTLDASRIAEGRLHLEPRALDVAGEVRALLAREGCQAHVQNVALTSEVPDGLVVKADPVALQTVLRNLVSNARKSVQQKSGGAIVVRGAREGREVRIDVEDDGVGFERRENERLFEKFYRPGNELRRKTKGSGLGLYIVRRFVEESGGRIRAHSDGEDRGAVFSLWLPASEEVPA